MEHPDELARFVDDAFDVLCDARCFPLLFTRSRGEPSIKTYDQSMDWRAGWISYAASKGTKVYLIANISSMRPPNAVVRKHIADSVVNDLDNPGFLGTGTVVPNALLRGVVTALTWVAGKEKSGLGDTASTLEDAIKTALQRYEQAGLPRPNIDPKQYELPLYPDEG